MITKYFAHEILKLMTAQSSSLSMGSGAIECQLALGTLSGETFSELTATDYARVRMNVNTQQQYTNLWEDISTGQVREVTNAKEFVFPEAKAAAWPTATHFGVYVGGKLICVDELTDPDGSPDETTGKYPSKPLTVGQNEVAVFRKNTLRLRID